jgi:hypothetical protein
MNAMEQMNTTINFDSESALFIILPPFFLQFFVTFSITHLGLFEIVPVHEMFDKIPGVRRTVEKRVSRKGLLSIASKITPHTPSR